ncbi:hypothetical protein COT82_00295 [Candidatus Campbellbacteria bacterium CG10_big_fil_rev_8_21_14_0_10_35_52]|uniref:Uncharacterized protein n=1 Tax=Candidatus Campbellbacteria bacterium CG10_big_fil_rev_8_21_14_0_10_35_52 TaxID=1974527 RepID=A0A2M6WW85_9BACT|nr:MAG: hypothetical protein COT82_00295 [Candidatus Campbellbacteria bacterium CG10_big_fil_rev_8_21_14_0_10_35_52]
MNKTNFFNLFGQNKIVSIIILIIAIIAVVLTVRQYTGANADRICSRVIESENRCSNGSWSDWRTVSQDVNTTTDERIYTGTKGIQRTVQFRTSVHNYNCSIQGGGATLISEVAACQIIETRVTKNESAVSGSAEESALPDEFEPITTTNEFTAPTTTTVTESVQLREIEANFMCSLDKEKWTECDKEIRVARKTTPIYLKSFVEDATSWTWFIENNDNAPLAEGQSIGTLQSPNSEMTRMDLEYGEGNKFTKEVTLNVEGVDRFGLSASGSVTKILNITVLDIKFKEF